MSPSSSGLEVFLLHSDLCKNHFCCLLIALLFFELFSGSHCEHTMIALAASIVLEIISWLP